MTAPTPRETADHAELLLMANASLEIYTDDVLVVGGTRRIHGDNIILAVKNGVDDLIANEAALLSEIAALRGERDELFVEFRAVCEERTKEADAVHDERRRGQEIINERDQWIVELIWERDVNADRATQAERQRDEAVGLLRVADAAMANITAFDDEIWSVIGSTNLSILKANRTAIRAFLTNQGADQ